MEQQLNLYSSNTDGSVTMANLNLILSPNEILPIAEEKQISREIFLFFMNCMLCVLIRIASSRRFWWVLWTYNYCVENRKKKFPKSLFASWPGIMINPQ